MPRREAADIASTFSAEIKAYTERIVASGHPAPKLVGFLANDDKAADMYARWTEKACTRDGICYELRRVDKHLLEAAVIEANGDPSVHGIIVYYPVFGGAIDDYLRDVISLEKDVEGLNHRYRYALYHNIRTLAEHHGKKCVVPCTPLAVAKILEALGVYERANPVRQQLRGRTIAVVNRSEVVGRPLAAMLANDGARVFSIDINSMLLYSAGSVPGTIKVEDTSISQDEAYAGADVVISGVPSKAFSIPASKLKPGVIAVNISQFQNFGEGVAELGNLVPAVGKVTIAMLERNLLRLHANFHMPAPRYHALVRGALLAAALGGIAVALARAR
eukprot:Transcript_16993.p1 GENE.Transcript_16993~~Transcript_16993.p1  ORF type:complete len:333 (-),score=160.62 Transcript_16993:111-1109(-)